MTDKSLLPQSDKAGEAPLGWCCYGHFDGPRPAVKIVGHEDDPDDLAGVCEECLEYCE